MTNTTIYVFDKHIPITIFLYAVDVVKSRYMSDLKGEYKSPIHCIVETYRRGGIRVFFQGWVPAYIRIGPHTVMSLVFMERVRTLLGLGNL